MSEFWDERFAPDEYFYGREPNEYFKREIEKLPPGKLLLPCEGEGRNAVYAATLGWDVFAFDTSREGQRKALCLAASSGVKIQYELISAEDFVPTQKFDALALIFCHFHSDVRRIIHNKFIDALRNGGHIILEGFNKKQIELDSGGPKDLEMLFSKNNLENDFKQLEFIKFEECQDFLNEGNNHKGQAELIRLTAKVRR